MATASPALPAKSSARRRRATCHPDRAHVGHGLCRACYSAWRYHNDTGYRQAQISASKHWNERHRQTRKLERLGLSHDALASLLAAQGNRCALDTGHEHERDLVIDHDHATGLARGLLCHAHNRSLGVLGDSLQSIRQLLRYLEDPPATQFLSGPVTMTQLHLF